MSKEEAVKRERFWTYNTVALKLVLLIKGTTLQLSFLNYDSGI